MKHLFGHNMRQRRQQTVAEEEIYTAENWDEEPEEASEEWDYDLIEDENGFDEAEEDGFADEPEYGETEEDGFADEPEYGETEEDGFADEAEYVEAEEDGFTDEPEYEEPAEEVEYTDNGLEDEPEYGETDYTEEAEYAEAEVAPDSDAAYDAYEDDIVYEDNWEETDEDIAEKSSGFGAGIAGFWKEFGKLDRIMLGAAAVVMILILATAGIYVKARMSAAQTSEFSEVGSQLDGIEIIGEKGLLAMADAEASRLAAAEAAAAAAEAEKEQQTKEYEEADYDQSVTVTLKTVSVQKDLKIKFVNQETGKLIPNVPFSVTITDPDGKSSTWSDDDMDGIIYKKNITPGTYKITVNALAGSAYADYTLPTETQSAEVKKDIAYQKIDVSDEVKTEAQINTATEEQQGKNIEVESTLTDTVTWVESTEVASTYVEVSKSDVQSPEETVLQAKAGSFLRVAQYTAAVSGTTSLKVGETAALTAGLPTAAKNITWSSSDASVAGVDASGKVTALKAGTAVISVSAAVASSVTPGDASYDDQYNGSVTVTVTEAAGVTLDASAKTVLTGSSATVTAAASGSITAASSDTGVATVSVSDKTITITGVSAGTANVTVTCGNASAVCAVTVKIHPKDDTATKLKDKSGNQLYVLENDSYREAVYADYYKDVKFFRKGNSKYTGWQTIDGKVYYYDASGSKVTGEQVIQGVTYTFDSDGVLVTSDGIMGIDVSKHNGSIDWTAVKNSGVSYVIIRCGYRGYTQGSLIIDSKFKSNIQGATAAGLKVGVYFFSQAVDEVEAVEEASFVLDCVKGYTISYPIFLDVEYSGSSGNKGRADGLDKATRTAVCKAFCSTIQNSGYTAGIYANKTWLESKLDASQLSSYKIWLAQYAADVSYTGHYDLWQYKATGKISGISGNVDMNLSYLGY